MVKLLKKLLSMILGLVMLGAITTLCALFVIRNLLSGSTIVDLAIKTANVGQNSYNNILTEITGEEIYEDFSDYISEEELKENLEEFISSTLKYYSGVDGAVVPSIEKIKEQVYDASKIYEEKTGKKVDYEELEKNFNKLDEGIANNVGVTTNKDVKKVFNFIYSDNIILIMIIVIIVSLILKFLLDGNILSLIKNIAVIALLNTLGNFGFGIALKNMFVDNENVQVVVNEIASSFNKIAIISVIISVILLIIWIVIKISKNRKNKEISYVNEDNFISNEMEYYNNLDNTEVLSMEEDINSFEDNEK